jgi:hypothetical protein
VDAEENTDEVYLPGWKDGAPDFVKMARRARGKVRVHFDDRLDDGTGQVDVKVNFDFEMSLPFVSWVIYYALDTISPGLVHVEGMSETAGPAPDEELAKVLGGTPHIILREKALLAVPWKDDESSQQPHEFIEEFEEPEEP